MVNQFFSVPFTALETLYSIVHSEINFRISGECEGLKVAACSVYIGELRALQQKNTTSRLNKILMNIEERDGQHIET